jgi:hypothetical protein
MSEPDEDPIARAERLVFEEEEANARATAGTGPRDEETGDELGAEVEAEAETDEE